MRLENGLGSVVKQSGNRKKPYIVRLTTGYEVEAASGKKKQIRKVIGYASTRKEGIKMLEYYKAKGRFDPEATFKSVHDRFSEYKYPSISHSMALAHEAAYKTCAILSDMRFADIKMDDLQKIIDTCGKNYPTLRKIKLYLNQLFDYALANEICAKNYAKYINIKQYKNKTSSLSKRDKIKKADLKILWDKKDNRYYQMVLFLIYTGVRVSEALNLKKSDIDLENQYFTVTSSKTENGIRRVPIADKIMPFVENWFSMFENSKYLFCTLSGEPFRYRNYYDSYFTPLMEECGMYYTPHYTRHTFISLMKTANINETIIKKIVGHESAMCLTERVYTHYEMRTMLDAVNKI
ncbi:site-specific integrase [Erysipelotrichaceae bacterium AF15-26LB]|nr:site-specific recombinase, phage integrase family [Erysipelotrichaceae bacterium 3_1_53]MCR0347797.1 site-specific integrase [[Clostridium] innocuum]RJV92374.1 site-specific integrase [Erysipelotrichaceae bacterium AF15-26LB]RJV92623.1 site-specific integrase [Erysipelotrichaceae bacterium AF19-24AC]